MRILGLSAFFHDSAAAVVADGHVVAAAEEERFSRERHTGRFPQQAIEYCLHEAGIGVDDLEAIAFFLDFSPSPFHAWIQGVLNTLQWFRANTSSLRHAVSYAHANPRLLWRLLRPYLEASGPSVVRWSPIVKRRLGINGPRRPLLIGVPHHFAHLAGSYMISGFDDAAIMVVDGRGEWATTTLAAGHCQRVDVLKTIFLPDSLGYLYGTLTAFLGFGVNADEGKVMGLSPYGRPAYREAFDRFLAIEPTGEFRLDTRYVDYPLAWSARYFPPTLIQVLGAPRAPEADLQPRHADIARTLQEKLEEALVALGHQLERAVDARRLCLSGGVAMNSAAVGRLSREASWSDIYVPPAPGDAGTALGAAIWAAGQLNGGGPITFPGPYLGPSFSTRDFELALAESGLSFTRRPDVVDPAARLLSMGYVLGWFQGRMEFGPRALGNRSILADPRDARIRDRVNTLKGRESWRPLAPSILADRAHEWFVEPGESPYMSFVKTVRPPQSARIPACVHVDGTARVHTVRPESNRVFWELLRRFELLTGVPCLLNTSFNRRGEPIVCYPRDAVRSFIAMGLDYLILGDFIAAQHGRLDAL